MPSYFGNSFDSIAQQRLNDEHFRAQQLDNAMARAAASIRMNRQMKQQQENSDRQFQFAKDQWVDEMKMRNQARGDRLAEVEAERGRRERESYRNYILGLGGVAEGVLRTFGSTARNFDDNATRLALDKAAAERAKATTALDLNLANTEAEAAAENYNAYMAGIDKAEQEEVGFALRQLALRNKEMADKFNDTSWYEWYDRSQAPSNIAKNTRDPASDPEFQKAIQAIKAKYNKIRLESQNSMLNSPALRIRGASAQPVRYNFSGAPPPTSAPAPGPVVASPTGSSSLPWYLGGGTTSVAPTTTVRTYKIVNGKLVPTQ